MLRRARQRCLVLGACHHGDEWPPHRIPWILPQAAPVFPLDTAVRRRRPESHHRGYPPAEYAGRSCGRITTLGEEYVSTPSEAEVALAHEVIDAGAAMILGHHPHVARPIELRRDAIIAYSLGNFISDMVWYPPLRESVLLTIELGDEPGLVETSRLQIADDYLPVPVPVRSPGDAQVVEAMEGLAESTYQTAVERTTRQGRIASYRHAAANMRRFRSPTLRQLISATIRNKLARFRRSDG
jgi:hypothetical protein